MSTATPDGNRMLDETRAILGLSPIELADLFGIPSSLFADWRVCGIPLARRASVERLYDLALVLNTKVMATRIPQIVRSPDELLAGRTILEVIQAEGVEPIYAYLALVFSYGAS